MNKDIPADQTKTADDAPAEPKQNNLGSRTVLALAFAFLGAKLSFLGNAMDVRKLFKAEGATFKEKLKNEFARNAANATGKLDYMKAGAKTIKYTLITGTVGIVAGAALGWVRGNRVASVKDIIYHPIKSLKLVFGPAPKASETQVADNGATQAGPATAQQDEASSTNWRDMASAREPSQVSR